MIIDNLYEQQDTWSVGHTAGQFTDSCSIYGNQLTEPIDLSAYYLGWVDSEKLPCFIGESDISGYDDGVVHCVSTVAPGRYPAGYVSLFGFRDHPWLVLLRDGIRQYTLQSQNFSLLNQLHPEYYAYNNVDDGKAKCRMYFLLAFYDSGQNFVATGNWQYVANDFQAFFNFIHDESGNAYFDMETTYGTIRIKRSDFADKPTPDDLYLSSTGYYIRVFLSSYVIGTGMLCNNGSNFGSNGIQFFVDLENTSGEKTTCLNTGVPDQPNWAFQILGYYDLGTERWYGGTVQFNVTDDIDISALIESSVNTYLHTDHLLAFRTQYLITVQSLCTFEDVRKALDVLFRIVPGTYVESYVNNQSWATDVSAQDEFLFRIKTGNITDPAFKNSLREWQYTDFQSSDFTEEDIPTPPDSDTPSEEPENVPDVSGDNIPNQEARSLGAPMKFITQYVLDANLLESLGNALWTSWLTPNTDVWKNFLFSLAADTGTFDIGAAMDFIISLRAYPFNLLSGGVTLVYSDGIYMGTGHTNFVPGSIPVFTSTIGAIYAGECTVTKENMEVYYDDFRDIYNCSVIVFLPFCGTVELNPTEVVGSTLKVWYFIDYQSGGCTAIVRRIWNGKEYNLAAKSGQIGFMLPITATNAGQLAATFAKDAMGVAKTLSGFVFDVSNSLSDNLSSLGSANSGSASVGKDSKDIMANNTFDTSLEMGKSSVNTGISLVNQALNVLSRSGIDMPYLSGGSGAESMMFPDKCYVQIRRGKYAKPLNYPHSQAHLNGSSNTISYYAGKFGNYPSTNNKGLCKFTGVDTTGLTCHDDERAEIVALLESGVYI